jgi:broad specificity phosphatase PhoE
MAVETCINTIRHAHTQFNSEKRYAGTIDVSLSDKGIQESTNAAEKLAKYKFDVVVTSNMKRAVETAQILAQRNTPIVKSKLCSERNFGIMEGCTWDDVQKFNPPILFIEVGNDLHSVNPKGGEAFEDLWQRAKKFRRFLFRKYRGGSVLVVSHGVFLQMLHGVLRGMTCIESLAFYPANLELASFRFIDDCLTEEKITKLVGTMGMNF